MSEPEDLDPRTLKQLSKFLSKNGMKIMDASHESVQCLQEYKVKMERIQGKLNEYFENQCEAIVATQVKLTRLAEELILADAGYDGVADDDIDDTYNAPEDEEEE